MDNWRVELNRLTTEFWIGVGVQSEVIVWLEGIPQHVKGVNSKVSELYAFQTYEEATEALCQIAKNVNGFIPNSWEAEPYAIITLKKHINLFLDKKISVVSLCTLVQTLDANFISNGFAGQPRPQQLQNLDKFDWLGNLWNCCDWCDEYWNYENSFHLVAEAKKVAIALNDFLIENYVG